MTDTPNTPTNWWDADPTKLVDAWQAEVANGNTKLGFNEWLAVDPDENAQAQREWQFTTSATISAATEQEAWDEYFASGWTTPTSPTPPSWPTVTSLSSSVA